MIRINLGKTRIQNADAIDSGYSGGVTTNNSSSQLVSVLIKVTVILLGLVVLLFIEGQNIDELRAEAARISAQSSSIQAKLDESRAQLQSLGSIQQDSKTLEDKLDLLKTLSRRRLREIKSLDYIQSAIPRRVWLTQIAIDRENYILAGRSAEHSEISLFVKKLEAGGYFSDVVLVKDAPVERNEFAVRQFEILARSEVVN
ncbi:PilN domain-containing protein [bacterium]|nr:PilN domain-containing protein [bacterium]